MSNPSPGAKSHPEHTIAITREGRRVAVQFAGKTVADTMNALTLDEVGYSPVLYIPLGDVATEFLTPSDHHTRCPFKGEARYWSIVAEGKTAENAVWGYDTPYDEVGEIAGHVAFYPDKVDITVM